LANNIPGSPFEDDEDEEDIVDRLTSSDAYMFPVIGSAVLGGLFLIIKYFDREWINFLLGLYFSFAGVGSVWKVRSLYLIFHKSINFVSPLSRSFDFW